MIQSESGRTGQGDIESKDQPLVHRLQQSDSHAHIDNVPGIVAEVPRLLDGNIL